jgi:hypothetical protein
MSLLVGGGIHIHLNQPHGGISEMRLDPLRIDECLGMGIPFVLSHVDLLMSR